MNTDTLYFSIADHARLSRLAAAAAQPGTADQLLGELNRGVVLDAAALPPTVVRLGSTVAIEDLETGDVDTYTLVLPEQADVDARRLSVLAPIGTAIVGYPEGAEVAWATPGGTRRLRIRRVSPPSESPQPTSLTFPAPLRSAS